jgi:hypothetical protein
MKFVVAMQSERRSAERQSLAIGTVVEDRTAKPSIVLMDEVSATGFRVVAAVPFAIGEQITVDLPVVGERRASVVHQTGMRFGCSFAAALTDEELRAIALEGAAQHELRKQRAETRWRPGVVAVAA